ncbi:MAG: hypothetical protein K2X39_08420, partial [Silvanigrellaceae bacterium]|nr:hypothetical protein [Silvanigrellaceae bacterium]
SLVFDTIYSEAQRRFLETLGTYERQFLQGLPQGEFDEIDHIPAAIALKQTNKTSDPRSVIASAADISEPFRNLFIAIMDPLCSRCGTKIEVNKVQDLKDFLLQKKNKNAVYFFSVPYMLPKSTKEKKKIFSSLLIEGYSRIFVKNKIFEIESLSETQGFNEIGEDIEILLDRISMETAQEELENRIETIWSQVKFTPHFSHLIVRQQDTEKIHDFHVQPFCKQCNSVTTLIQQSDLDWQSVLGACKMCSGIGNIPILDENKVIPNPALSLEQGALKPWSSETFAWAQLELLEHCNKRKIKTNIPYQELSEEVKKWIWDGEDESYSSKKGNKEKNKFFSLRDFFAILEQEKYKPTSRIMLAKYRRYVTCPDCNGERLCAAGRNATSLNKQYHKLFQCEITETLQWLDSLKEKKDLSKKLEATKEVFDEVYKKIKLLCRLGLGSTSLFRRCKTLSGGEYQRVLLTRVIGNGLTDALYVLDEPSVGLGHNEVSELIGCLEELRDLGNTIIMVEHDKQLIKAADVILELGPGGGEKGGSLLKVKDGIPDSFRIVDSLPKVPNKE